MSKATFLHHWGLASLYLLLIFFFSAMPLGAPAGSDWFFHFCEYFILGLFLMRGARLTYPWRFKPALALGFFCLVFLSALDEIFHSLLPYRQGSVGDFAFDVLGGTVGLLSFELLKIFFKKKEKLYANTEEGCANACDFAPKPPSRNR